jgi:hypothetical protein
LDSLDSIALPEIACKEHFETHISRVEFVISRECRSRSKNFEFLVLEKGCASSYATAASNGYSLLNLSGCWSTRSLPPLAHLQAWQWIFPCFQSTLSKLVFKLRAVFSPTVDGTGYIKA